MSSIRYQQGELYMESCSLQQIAEQYETPCFVYSRAEIARNYLDYAEALGERGQVYYAVKANSNLAVLQVLAKLGSGFDIVSAGELERVVKAGGDPSKVIFSGVGKTEAEMKRALALGIACFNVESEAELQVLAQVAAREGKRAKISLRVNPDVDAKTHPYISTGLRENKFGVDIKKAPQIYAEAQRHESLDIVGIDCHIGSQLTEIQPFLESLSRLKILLKQLKSQGINISHLDLGGGLGVQYRDETPPAISTYVKQILAELDDPALTICFEPGRSLVANAGVMLTKVLYLKPTEHKNFAIIDAAMNDNIRPALYQAWQEVLPIKQHATATPHTWDLVGPVCETGDFLAKERELAIAAGDILGVLSSGAYCFTMSSNYNSRPRAAEILVDGESHHLVRARETEEDLTRGEQLLPSA